MSVIQHFFLSSLTQGLLASKVGHFYGMSVAENSYIHQHYKVLAWDSIHLLLLLFLLLLGNVVATCHIEGSLCDSVGSRSAEISVRTGTRKVCIESPNAHQKME